MKPYPIIDLHPSNELAIKQIAMMLVNGFREHHPYAWSDLDSALVEVNASFTPNRLSRVAVDGSEVVGWIGGIKQYEGKVWEIHPLVVRTDYQRRGIGQSLVQDLEQRVRNRGGLTLWVGTDDENYQTTLSGVNLYPKMWEAIAQIKNLNNHPYEFYQKCGFIIVGVMPDANGVGKPDIYMAKPVAPNV